MLASFDLILRNMVPESWWSIFCLLATYIGVVLLPGPSLLFLPLHSSINIWKEFVNVSRPLSGDEPKAGSSDHLHYIKIFICMLVFYYIILIFFFGKRKKIAGDNKNESFWLFVCVYILKYLSIVCIFLSIDWAPWGQETCFISLVSSFLITVLVIHFNLSNIWTKLKSNIRLMVVLLNSAKELNWGIIQMKNLHTFICVLNIDWAVDHIHCWVWPCLIHCSSWKW